MIRCGVVGCGAVVQQLQLPALMGEKRISLDAVADVNGSLARAVAEKCGVRQIRTDYTKMTDIDAVLLATPHYLHAPMAEHFLKSGVHVLCEKPFVVTGSDAERLVALKKEKKLVLNVGVFRRYYPVSKLIRELIAKEWLGCVVNVDLEEGGQYAWDLKSKFMMERDKAGGGVLIDTGAHAVDRLLWWFGQPETEVLQYRDNSSEGIETDCECKFSMNYNGREICGRFELSRTRGLRNTCIIEMEHGRIEVPANSPCDCSFIDERLKVDGAEQQPIRIDASSGNSLNARDITEYFVDQIRDFCNSIEDSSYVSSTDAESVVSTVRLTERCYAMRLPMDEPWVDEDAYGLMLRKAGVA